MEAFFYTSFWYIFSWLFSEIKLFKLRHFKISDDFDYTVNEKKTISKKINDISIINRQLNLLKNNINNAYYLGRNLKKNKSGKFDNRNSLGKKLNSELRNAFSAQNEGQKKLKELIKDKEKFESKPIERANHWIKIYSKAIAKRSIIISFFPIVLLFNFINKEKDIGAISLIIWFIFGYIIIKILQKQLKNKIF